MDMFNRKNAPTSKYNNQINNHAAIGHDYTTKYNNQINNHAAIGHDYTTKYNTNTATDINNAIDYNTNDQTTGNGNDNFKENNNYEIDEVMTDMTLLTIQSPVINEIISSPTDIALLTGRCQYKSPVRGYKCNKSHGSPALIDEDENSLFSAIGLDPMDYCRPHYDEYEKKLSRQDKKKITDFLKNEEDAFLENRVKERRPAPAPAPAPAPSPAPAPAPALRPRRAPVPVAPVAPFLHSAAHVARHTAYVHPTASSALILRPVVPDVPKRYPRKTVKNAQELQSVVYETLKFLEEIMHFTKNQALIEKFNFFAHCYMNLLSTNAFSPDHLVGFYNDRDTLLNDFAPYAPSNFYPAILE